MLLSIETSFVMAVVNFIAEANSFQIDEVSSIDIVAVENGIIPMPLREVL